MAKQKFAQKGDRDQAGNEREAESGVHRAVSPAGIDDAVKQDIEQMLRGAVQEADGERRELASGVLQALGVNTASDHGCPTVETILQHGIEAECLILDMVIDALDAQNDPRGQVLSGVRERLDFLAHTAFTLSQWHARGQARSKASASPDPQERAQ